MKKAIIWFGMFAMVCFVTLNAEEAASSEEKAAPEAAATEGIKWHDDLQAALDEAKASNKVVIANFTGSDWCGWCIKLVKEVFSQKEFIDAVKDKYVFAEIDFPKAKPISAEQKAKNAEYQKKYGIRGYPSILLLKADGTVLAKTGYKAGGPAAYTKHLEEEIAKAQSGGGTSTNSDKK